MNTLRLVSVLLVLVLAIVVVESRLGPQQSQAPSPPPCTQNGQSCSTSTQCCSGSNCFNGPSGTVCQAAQCFPPSCNSNYNCCIGQVCVGGVCGNPSQSPSASPTISVSPSATLSASVSPVALTPGQLTPTGQFGLSVPSPQAVGIAGGRLIVGINSNTDVVAYLGPTSSLTSSSQPVATLEGAYTSGEFFGTYTSEGTAYVWIANAGSGSTSCNRYRSNSGDNGFTQDASFNCGGSNGLTVDSANSILYSGSSSSILASVTQYNLATPFTQLSPSYNIPENNSEIQNVITCNGGIYVLSSFATPNNFFHFSTGSSSPDLAINLDNSPNRPLPIGATMDPTCTYLYVSGFSQVDVYRAPFSASSKPIQSYGVGNGLEGIVYDSSASPNRVFVASSQDNTVYGIAVSNT